MPAGKERQKERGRKKYTSLLGVTEARRLQISVLFECWRYLWTSDYRRRNSHSLTLLSKYTPRASPLSVILKSSFMAYLEPSPKKALKHL